jgi:hypothetical protein
LSAKPQLVVSVAVTAMPASAGAPALLRFSARVIAAAAAAAAAHCRMLGWGFMQVYWGQAMMQQRMQQQAAQAAAAAAAAADKAEQAAAAAAYGGVAG